MLALDRLTMQHAVILPGVYARSLLYRNPDLTNVYVNRYYAMYDYASIGRIGSLLLVRAILGVMSLTGGSLMLAGRVCYVGVLALGVPAPAMVRAGCWVSAWTALLAAATAVSRQPPADDGHTASENQPRRRHDQVGAGHVNLLRVCEGCLPVIRPAGEGTRVQPAW